MIGDNEELVYFGTAWYPEHWPESRWALDLELMRAANLNVVRIGDYAWSRLEPAQGDYRLDWMHRAVDLAHQFSLFVVIATPTDAPPAWMTEKYPQILRVEQDGRTTTHGGRRHFNPLDPRFREFSTGIAAALSERFGKHPNVIGWQVGNEFCRYSYDEHTRKLFQQWLRTRYETLESLNRRWTTSYWSQEYTDWSQIHIPVGWQNPCLELAFFRFMSDAFAKFQRIQADAIRSHASDRQWITTNMHGTEELDFTQIVESADIASWDAYPPTPTIDHLEFGWVSDFCRTIKRRPHWIMETQSQHKNWAPPNCSMPRGVLRGLTWHFLGHGAQAVLFWQWRAALGGQEQYHGSIIAPDGNPKPHYAELKEIGAEIRRLAPLLARASVTTSVALVYSYVNQRAVDRQRHHTQFDPLKHMIQFYRPFREMALDVDIISPAAISNRYRLIVAPHLHTLDAQLIDKLMNYVRSGGHLLLGPRSGFKDEHNTLLPSRQPGAGLSELLGASVEEYHTLDQPVPVNGSIGQGVATIWAEYLTPTAQDVQILFRYGTYNGWIDDKPAMITRAVERGRISYLGAWLEAKLMRAVMEWATRVSEVFVHFPTPPKSVEVCCRAGNGREVYVLINHGPNPERVQLPRPMINALTETLAESNIELPAYGVSVMVDSLLTPPAESSKE